MRKNLLYSFAVMCLSGTARISRRRLPTWKRSVQVTEAEDWGGADGVTAQRGSDRRWYRFASLSLFMIISVAFHDHMLCIFCVYFHCTILNAAAVSAIFCTQIYAFMYLDALRDNREVHDTGGDTPSAVFAAASPASERHAGRTKKARPTAPRRSARTECHRVEWFFPFPSTGPCVHFPFCSIL